MIPAIQLYQALYYLAIAGVVGFIVWRVIKAIRERKRSAKANSRKNRPLS